MILPLTDAQSGSYIVRSVPSTYYWRRVWSDGAQQQLYVCLLLADEDVSVRTGITGVNVECKWMNTAEHLGWLGASAS